MKRIKWNIRVDEKDYMIELEYNSILKNKIKVYVDGNHIEDVKVILDEIGADYYFNIGGNNVLIYSRPIKSNINYRIALNGFDYESAKRVKVIDLKARKEQDKRESKIMLFLGIPFNILYFFFYKEIIGFDSLWITEHNLIRYQTALYFFANAILFLLISEIVAKILRRNSN